LSEIETKPITAKAKKPKQVLFTIEGGGSDTTIDFNTASAADNEQFTAVMRNIIGYHEANRYQGTWPINILLAHKARIEAEVEGELSDVVATKLVDEINKFETAIKEQLSSKLEKGEIEFFDVPYLFSKGTEVSVTHDGEHMGGLVDKTEMVQSFFGVYYKVHVKSISNVSGSIQEGQFVAKVPYFAGLSSIDLLSVRPITEDLKAKLVERGRLYRKLASGSHYVQYEGQLVRSSWWSPRRYRADGRVMIDMNSFSQIDNNQFDDEQRNSGFQSDNYYERNESPSIEITDEHLWRTYPFLYGFSFRAKQWGRMAVSTISEIQFREDAFQKLVLAEEDKELVRVIVEDETEGFSDLIDGKGGGSIFLLHGPPGQGKTLTAEAIAEELKRPLYSISVGELGVSPDELEETLREILDVATIWNAVLLLDEADIFLEARDEKDIVRNAMVGVFLRLLEYHQGVLFLTTNRVRNIDEAFYSRISIALKFEESDHAKRVAIWTNLLSAANVTGLNIESLATHDVNGRQIKNIIKTAAKLARSKNEDISNSIIESVIERTTKFSIKNS
jgi:DNA polymerase III delta prime subunit